jgi:hypothetical protein
MNPEAPQVVMAQLNKNLAEQVSSPVMQELWKLIAKAKFTRMQIFIAAGFTPEQAFQLLLQEGAK